LYCIYSALVANKVRKECENDRFKYCNSRKVVKLTVKKITRLHCNIFINLST